MDEHPRRLENLPGHLQRTEHAQDPLCPKDSLRGRSATNFTDDLKAHVSYFIGIDATDTNPAALLSGDDNFVLNQSPVRRGNLSVSSTTPLEWDASRHVIVTKKGWLWDSKIQSGYLLLTDDSIQGGISPTLANDLRHTGLATNRLYIP